MRGDCPHVLVLLRPELDVDGLHLVVIIERVEVAADGKPELGRVLTSYDLRGLQRTYDIAGRNGRISLRHTFCSLLWTWRLRRHVDRDGMPRAVTAGPPAQ